MNSSCKDSYLDGVLKYYRYTKFTFNKKYAIYFGLSIVFTLQLFTVGRDSAVGIAIRYGLNGPGIESQWGRDFPHPSRPALWPTQPPIQWVPGLFRG